MKKILAVLAVCSLFVGQASAGLIFQDDFGTGGNVNFSGTSSSGVWKTTQGNVDLWNFGGDWVGLAVDLNGFSLGGIETTDSFTFLANDSYILSFLLGKNNHYQGNGIEYGFRNAGGILASGAIPNVRTFLSGLGVNSTVVSLFYSPVTDVNASIFFTSTGDSDKGGAIIDNVSVVPEVPEPSTLAILALSLIGLGARRFKK
jgi:hypothetical protein